jgi:membrane associated rhomboid family serine protease
MVNEDLGIRLVSELLRQNPGAVLAAGGQDAARISFGGAELVLVGNPARLDSVLAQHKSGLLHLALFGGTEAQGWRALERRWPFWQMSRQLAFHHVDADGRYYHVKGAKLPLLRAAAEKAPYHDPMSADELEARLHSGHAAAMAANEFVARRSVPWVTIAIGVACALTFALEELWGGSQNISALVRMGANPGHPALRAPWTLLSSAFLHIGVEHVALNLLALFSFGPLLEKVLGGPRYLLLYFASALGGSLLSAAGHTSLVSAGASGALWGLMVGGAALITWPRGILPPMLAARARRQVWQPVILNAIYSFTPGVDWLCHLGGGIAGGLLVVSGAILIGLDGERAPSSSPNLRLGAVAAAALCVASLCLSWITGKPWELGAPPVMERQFTGFAGLSLEVPLGMEATREAGTLTFGNLNRDPILVEVRMGSSGENDYTPQQMVEERAELRRALHDHPPPGATLVSGVIETEVAGVPAYSADLKMDSGLTARTYNWVVPEGVLVVRVYQRPEMPSGWRSVPDSILHSLKTKGAKVD